jgi:hypothetical protein
MNIFEFTVSLNLPGRKNPWAITLLLISVFTLVQGISDTHWMAYYRLGDSIVPQEEALVRVGPLHMSEIRTRNRELVAFSDANGNVRYKVDSYLLGSDATVVHNLVKDYSNGGGAYLYIFERNPLQKVWGAEVSVSIILTYARSLKHYRISSPIKYSYFWDSASFFVFFLFSIFEIERRKNN